MSSAFAKVLAICTGVVIAGQTLALALGTHILSGTGNPWISLKNDLLLVLDIVAGLGLVVAAAMNGRLVASSVLYVLVFISVVAHGYRDWEYAVHAPNAFCANAPLFVVNNLKLIGLLVTVGLIGWRITSRG